jgi:uncharacterized protein (TIGR04255 family)
MVRIRHLNKAPITEAVLDFKVRLPAGADVAELKSAVEAVSKDYPNVEEAWLIEGSFAYSPGPARTSASSSRRANGFFLRSPDAKQVAQFRMDGFTFSRLAPYTSWGKIAPEAFRLWDLYRNAARPEALFRVAVRYINHIHLREMMLEVNDILVSAPQIPADLPQVASGFLTRVEVPLPMPNTRVGIVQAFNTPPAAASDNLLLDLDVFRDEELDLCATSLVPIFEQMRNFKNVAFFGSLTEPVTRRFE